MGNLMGGMGGFGGGGSLVNAYSKGTQGSMGENGTVAMLLAEEDDLFGDGYGAGSPGGISFGFGDDAADDDWGGGGGAGKKSVQQGRVFNMDGTVTVDGMTMTYLDHKESEGKKDSTANLDASLGKHKKSAEADYTGFSSKV